MPLTTGPGAAPPCTAPLSGRCRGVKALRTTRRIRGRAAVSPRVLCRSECHQGSQSAEKEVGVGCASSYWPRAWGALQGRIEELELCLGNKLTLVKTILTSD